MNELFLTLIVAAVAAVGFLAAYAIDLKRKHK